MTKQMQLAVILIVGVVAFAPCNSTPAHAQATDGGTSERLETDAGGASEQRDRLSTLKENLNLTTEQEKLWGPVEEVFIQLRANRLELRSTFTSSEPADQIERLRRRAELVAKRAEALKKLADAIPPLWATLSDKQKRELSQRLAMAPGRSDQERMSYRYRDDDVRNHHRRHRDYDDDRDRSGRGSGDRDDRQWGHHRGDRMMGRRGGDDTDDRDYMRSDRMDRGLRDRDDGEWRHHRRDRMTGRRGYDDTDDRDHMRSDRDRHSHWRSQDDYRPRAREFGRDRRDYDPRSDRDYCRYNRDD